MKKYSGHPEAWGQFVDVKVNAPELLQKEITKKRPARVWISGVCDPYQGLEARYRLTRACLEILSENGWPVTVQTRSPLVLRDIDVLKSGKEFEVGMSITTSDDKIRKLFEPSAPAINERVRTLDELHRAGIRTFAMIAPMLPGAEGLADLLIGKVDHILYDRMNYHYSDWIYRKYHLEEKLTDAYFIQTKRVLSSKFAESGIPSQ
jgi:DNA repair photolyase